MNAPQQYMYYNYFSRAHRRRIETASLPSTSPTPVLRQRQAAEPPCALPDGCQLILGDRIADEVEDGEELRPAGGEGAEEAKRRRVEQGQGSAAVSGSPEGDARDSSPCDEASRCIRMTSADAWCGCGRTKSRCCPTSPTKRHGRLS